MAIDNDKLLSAIDAYEETSYGNSPDSGIARHRAALIESYLGYNVNPSPPGRSQVVDRSVFQTVHTILPSLVRIFSSGDEVVKFVPTGPEDEQAAEQTTQYINYLVTQRNQWEQICADWIHDALVVGNGYAMAYWDTTKRVYRETYEGQTDEQVAALMQDDDATVIQHSQRPDDEENQKRAEQYQQLMMQWQMMAMQAQQQGQMPPPPPPEPPQANLHDLVIEYRDEQGKLKICVLPPEHTSVAEETPDWTLEQCPYFEFRQDKTIADLRAMGLDVPEDISDSTDRLDNDSAEDEARNRMYESNVDDDGQGGVMRKVTVRMIWVKADAEEDEEARLYYVIAVGRTILWAEQCSRIPVASLTPQPMPHRHPGMSIAEMVQDLQDIKTAIKRGALDNLYLSNNGRYAISDKVNLDDFLDSRPGGAVRLVDGALPGEGHIFPLTHPFAFDSVVGSLEYFDQDGQNRTGASRYFSGTDAGAINKTASGTAMLQNAASQRVEHIARMMAPAFEHLFSVCQEIISKHQDKGDVIRLNNKWVNVDPTAWKTRRDAKISVGVGAGNKESMLQALSMQMQEQVGLIPAGIVEPQNLYETMIEKAKLMGFANPQKFWTNPQEKPQEPQQPPPELLKLEAEKQQAQMDAQIEAKRLELEAEKLRLEQEKVKLEAMKAEQDAQIEKYKADLDAQTKIAVAQMNHENQKELETVKAQNQIGMEHFKAETTDKLEEKKIRLSKDPAPDATERAEQALEHFSILSDQFMNAMQGMQKVLSASKRVKRGPDGMVEGVEVVSPDGEVLSTNSVLRGPDGRIEGLQ